VRGGCSRRYESVASEAAELLCLSPQRLGARCPREYGAVLVPGSESQTPKPDLENLQIGVWLALGGPPKVLANWPPEVIILPRAGRNTQSYVDGPGARFPNCQGGGSCKAGSRPDKHPEPEPPEPRKNNRLALRHQASHVVARKGYAT
jgi:hypothetical protein